MQDYFHEKMYAALMTSNVSTTHLRELRETAGLSLRELARRIGEDHSNVRYWETTGKQPRSDVLIPMAKALGVTLEELLGQPKPRRVTTPGGRLGEVFDSVSKLPRRQQQKVIEFVEAFVEKKNDS